MSKGVSACECWGVVFIGAIVLNVLAIDYVTMHTIQLTITGMTCGHCEKAVMSAIKSVDINAQASIDRAANTATISSEQPAQAFVDAIEQEGYTATV